MQTDATRTCELLVGLRDVTALGVDERLRQPDEVCVDLQHPGSIALSRSQKVQVPLFDAVIKVGHAPKCRYTGDLAGFGFYHGTTDGALHRGLGVEQISAHHQERRWGAHAG